MRTARGIPGWATFSIYALCLIITAIIIGLKLWVIASLSTSGIKAISKSCPNIYPIETYFEGNWFCPTKGDTK